MVKSGLADKAYFIIQQQIFAFELFPGQVVSDYLLSKELGMSRTPIRQALQRLHNDGLLEPLESGKTSYRVADITAEEIRDLFDFREGIETTALRLAFQKMNPIPSEQIQLLEQIYQSMVDTNHDDLVTEHFVWDQKFHNSLVSLSGNRRLIKAHDELLLQLTRMRFLTFLKRSLQNKACNDHQELLQAIKQGDCERGVKVLTHHIRTSRDDYISLLKNDFSMNSVRALHFFVKDSGVLNRDELEQDAAVKKE